MVELEAFATDCRVHGLVDLGQGRLTDILNASSELQLRDVRLESLVDGHELDVPELTVTWDELCAVIATGTRGEEARRLRTHTTRVEVNLGPYRVEGALHGAAAADPLGSVLRRPRWLPLTNARVTYRRGADEIAEDVDTLVVNRDLATSIRGAPGETLSLRWEAVPSLHGSAPRVSETSSPAPDAQAVPAAAEDQAAIVPPGPTA